MPKVLFDRHLILIRQFLCFRAFEERKAAAAREVSMSEGGQNQNFKQTSTPWGQDYGTFNKNMDRYIIDQWDDIIVSINQSKFGCGWPQKTFGAPRFRSTAASA